MPPRRRNSLSFSSANSSAQSGNRRSAAAPAAAAAAKDASRNSNTGSMSPRSTRSPRSSRSHTPVTPVPLSVLRQAALRGSSPPTLTSAPLTYVSSHVRHALSWLSRPLKLYKLHDIPLYLQDNEYIHTGHRAYYTWAECARSAVHVHNETVNIWTHVLGACAFAVFIAQAFDDIVHPNATPADRAVLALYHLTAGICLACSGIFHTFHCHGDRHVFDRMAVTDYTGIATLLFGSFTSLVYFAFRPHPKLLPIPLTITALSSLAGVILPWFSFFRSYKYRLLRTFIFFALSTAIFVSVGWATFEIWTEVRQAWTWKWWVWGLGVLVNYCGGAVIYAVRFPECLAPGKFDIVGASHQIWHLMVIGGAVCHWGFLCEVRDWRLAQDAAAKLLNGIAA